MNLIIVATSIGFGMIPIASPNFYDQFPTWFATIFHSGISSAAIMAITLNLVFNDLTAGKLGSAVDFRGRYGTHVALSRHCPAARRRLFSQWQTLRRPGSRGPRHCPGTPCCRHEASINTIRALCSDEHWLKPDYPKLELETIDGTTEFNASILSTCCLMRWSTGSYRLPRPGTGGGQQDFRRPCCANPISRLYWPRPTTKTENPLWHGEIHTLKRFYEVDGAERPDPRDLHISFDA